MSTGKRLAKRSIIGTRVCAHYADGKYYSGVIQAVKTPSNGPFENNNSITLTAATRYTVRFDPRQGGIGRTSCEFHAEELIGPGFRSVGAGVERLLPAQRVFVTYNGREVCGEVQDHDTDTDTVTIQIQMPNDRSNDRPLEVLKRLDEVRLLESRKSARLADQDTDFARLADMASSGDRKRNSTNSIDVPPFAYMPALTSTGTTTAYTGYTGSRKRRPSFSQDDNGAFLNRDPMMDECNAALVLMSLSCSPMSNISGISWSSTSPGSSSSASSRSTPSPPPTRDSVSPTLPPLSSSSASDEGIGMDYLDDELPRKKKSLTRIVYECKWRQCNYTTNKRTTIEAHVRNDHLLTTGDVYTEGDEEFYYTELEVGHTSPAPTLSHRDMARPPHEDPEYQRQLVGNLRAQRLIQNSNNNNNSHPDRNQYHHNSSPMNIPSASQYHGPNYSFANTSSSSTNVYASQSPQYQIHSTQHNQSAQNIASSSSSLQHHPQSPHKVIRLSPSGAGGSNNSNSSTSSSLGSTTAVLPTPTFSIATSSSPQLSPVSGVSSASANAHLTYGGKGAPVSPRRVRGENKKCRKVYGMDNREQWCTQCKWKKACTRFGD